MKGLEALAELYSYIKPSFDYQTAKAVEDYKIIEKELKAFAIIRNYGYFDEQGDLIIHLPTNRKQEHELLIEVLK